MVSSMYFRLNILLIIFLLTGKPAALGQDKSTIDGLIRIVNTAKEDTVKVNALNELAWEYYKNNNAIKAREYARRAIRLSDSTGYKRGSIDGRVRLGQIASKQGEYNEAEQLFLKVLEAEIEEDYQYGIGRAKAGLSQAYVGKGDLKKALQYSLEALKIFEDIQNNASIALLNNNLGIIYEKMAIYDQALLYYHKSLEIREQSGKPEDIGASYLDIGILYTTHLKEYTKAMEYLEKSIAIFEKLKDNDKLAKLYNSLGTVYFNTKDYDNALHYYEKARLLKEQPRQADAGIYNNLGAVYYKQNNLDKALQYYRKSDSIYRKNADGAIFIDSYINMGNIYRVKNDYERAIAYYRKALEYAEATAQRPVRLKILGDLSETYTKLGQYDSALYYSRSYINLNDSISNSYVNAIRLSKDKALEDAELRYKTTSQLRRIYITIIILPILFFSVFYGFRQKQKAQLAVKNRQLGEQKIEELLRNQELKSINAMMEGQEEERKRIARDLHDRLGSMLAMVKVHFKSVEENIEHLKADNKKQYEKANTLLDTACEEVRKIAHDMASGVLMKFGLVAALNDLKATLEQTRKIRIEFLAHGLDDRLEHHIEITLYRIIQELISNILKHADADEITIQLVKSKTGLNITVEDNGAGFDMHGKKADGIGLRNVASRVEKLQGELRIDSSPDNGTTITIDIPLNS